MALIALPGGAPGEQVRRGSKSLSRFVGLGGAPRGNPKALASRRPPAPLSANSADGQQQPPAALGFAGQGPGGIEHNQVAPAQTQANPGTSARRDDDEPSPLMIPHGRPRGPHQDQGSRPKTASGAIARRAATDHRDPRRVEAEAKLGPGPAQNLDARPPGPGQPGEQEAMALRPLDSDVGVPPVQPADKLGVDPAVVAKLGNEDRGVHRPNPERGVEVGLSVHHRPRPRRLTARRPRRRRPGRARPAGRIRGRR